MNQADTLDSVDLSQALLGRSPTGRQSLLTQDNTGRSFGWREGDWKLVRTPRKPAAGEKLTAVEYEEQLFLLSEDPGETRDLAAAEPQRLKQLRAALDAALQSRELLFRSRL